MISIDKNDVVAIQVARAEQLLHEELNAAAACMKTCEVAIRDIGKKLEESYHTYAQERTASARALLQNLATEYTGLESTASSTYTPGSEDLTVSIELRKSYPYFSLTKRVPYTAAQRDLQQQRTAQEVALAAAQERAVTARRKLAKLPALERQYRALLAEKTLATTAEGRRILAQITSDVPSDILALPAT